jgi:chromosome segregation ATPase
VPATISPAKRNEIIAAYLAGYAEPEVARKTKEEARVVKREITSFEKFWNKKGIWAAAEEFDVTETVAQLHQVTEAMLERKLSPTDMADGAGVALALKAAGQEGEAALRFVRDVLQRSKAKELTAAKVVEDCSEIERLEQKYGKGFDLIRQEYDMMVTRVPVLKTQQQKLSKQCEEKRKELADLFEEHDTAKKDLEQFVETRRALSSAGLDLTSLEEATRVLSGLKEEGFDTAKLSSVLKSIDGLESRVGDLGREEASLKEEVDGLRKKKEELEKETQAKQKIVEEIWRYEQTGLTYAGIQEIRNLVVQTSANHGLSAAEAMQKFQEDLLKHYDMLLGLAPEVKALEERKGLILDEFEHKIKALPQALEAANAKLAAIGEERAKVAAELEAYAGLKDKGVTDAMMAAWAHLLDDANLSADSLWASLKEMANFEIIREGKAKEVKEAEEELRRLTSEAEAQVRKKAELEEEYKTEMAAIDGYVSAIKKGIDAPEMAKWGEILEETNLSAAMVGEELRQYKGLSQHIEGVQKHVAELEHQQATLTENVAHLSSAKAQLEKDMEGISLLAKASLQSYADELQKAAEGMAMKTAEEVRSIDEAVLSATKKMSDEAAAGTGSVLKATTEKLDAFVKEVEQTYLRAKDVGEEIGRLEALRPILHFMAVGEAQKLELLAFGTGFADKLEQYAEKGDLPKLELAAVKLRDALRDELKGGPA